MPCGFCTYSHLLHRACVARIVVILLNSVLLACFTHCMWFSVSLCCLYLQRIKSLEMEIGVLEQERRLGSREIDAVDSEIRARRQEITNISRKYLNYFYYF